MIGVAKNEIVGFETKPAREGSVIQQTLFDLIVRNKTIAVGETVKVGENFGLRITHIGDLKSTIQSLAGSKK